MLDWLSEHGAETVTASRRDGGGGELHLRVAISYMSAARGFGKLFAGGSFGALAGLTQDATSVELALGNAVAGAQALVRPKIRSVTVHLTTQKGAGPQLGPTVKLADVRPRVVSALAQPRIAQN